MIKQTEKLTANSVALLIKNKWVTPITSPNPLYTSIKV